MVSLISNAAAAFSALRKSSYAKTIPIFIAILAGVVFYFNHKNTVVKAAMLEEANKKLSQLVESTEETLRDLEERQLQDERRTTVLFKEIQQINNNLQIEQSALDDIKDPCLDYMLPDSFIDEFLQIKPPLRSEK